MEKLLEQQSDLTEKIYQLSRNFKKDSEIRKTTEYLEKRSQELTDLCNKYTANDGDLLALSTPLPDDHPYFNERRQVQQACQKMITDIAVRQEKAANTKQQPLLPDIGPVKTIDDTKQDDFSGDSGSQIINTFQLPNKPKGLMDRALPKYKLIDRQVIRINHLHSIIAQADQILQLQKPKVYSIEKLRQLKRTMEKIDELHEEILLEMSDEDIINEEYFIHDLYSNISRIAEDCMAKLQQAISSVEEKNRATVQTKLELPKIQVPHFYGDYTKWMSFHDLFKKLIHENNDLSDTHKMSYLKSHVAGQAAKIISHLDTLGDNYKAAWTLMENRYNNKRLLISTQLTTLLSQSAITTESANSIRNMHDTINDCMYAIKNLGVNTENWDVLIIHLMTKKLDNETIRLYEASLQDSKEIQKLSDFIKFLERRFNTLQAIQSQRNIKTPIVSTIKGFLSTTTKSCKQCSGPHQLAASHKFNKLSSTLQCLKL